jgi:hypothetical protein
LHSGVQIGPLLRTVVTEDFEADARLLRRIVAGLKKSPDAALQGEQFEGALAVYGGGFSVGLLYL